MTKVEHLGQQVRSPTLTGKIRAYASACELSMAKRRLGLMVALVCLGFGAATTVFWLTLPQNTASFARSNPWPLLVSLLLVAALTSLNLGIRWIRWHYLLRRFRFSLPAKDSLKAWTVTLPAIATPFYLGELVRGGLLSRRYPEAFGPVSGVWAVERITDALVIGGLLLAVQQRWQFLALAIGFSVFSVVAIRLTSKSETVGTVTRPAVIGATVASGLIAWTLPMVGLWSVLRLLRAEIPLAGAAETFGMGTLLGGLTGIPLGIGVTGSSMIVQLQAYGVGLEVAALAIAVFRAGTAWYALGLGIFAFLHYKDYLIRLLGLSQQVDHFDLIALGYEENIPQHMSDRLLARKTKLMRDRLKSVGAENGWNGLDIGCGQGWYSSEMAAHGYSINACDLSIAQVEQAQHYIRRQGANVRLCVADARFLPYVDGAFEFAYGINVIHHMPQDGSFRNVASEILRVLKPGGLFFLQEINTRNPLFRFYMGYIFPLLKDIDEGTESWVMPKSLPALEGADWQEEIQYFNFLPDFTPRIIVGWLAGFEQFLEGTFLSRWSSHYVACLGKNM